MSVRRWIPVLVLALAGATACERSATAPELRSSTAPVVHATTIAMPAAMRQHLLVGAEWLKANIDRPNVVVLHFGVSDVAYKAGHVPGARLITLAQIQGLQGTVTVPKPIADLRALLESVGVGTRDRVIVTGDTPREAARGFFILDYVGHQQVSMLDGGLAAWKLVNGDVSLETPIVEHAGKIATRPEPKDLVDTPWMIDHYEDARLVLLDARDGASFAAGHIPGAKNLVWNSLFQSTGAPVLKDVDTLRAYFAAAGVNHHTPIIAYCKTGMTSSMVYFVARYLGYDVRLYSESIDGWKAAGMPVVQ